MSGNCPVSRAVESLSASSLSQPRSWASASRSVMTRQAWRSGRRSRSASEGSPVSVAWKQLIAIDEAEQRHRLPAQRMDDMAIVNHLVVLAGSMRAPPREGHEWGAADEQVQPVVEQAHPEPMADQARGHGVEHLAQREAARGGDADADFLVIGGALARQGLQFGAFEVDALGIADVASADDLVDEAAIGGQIGEIGRTPHQQRVLDGALEMAVRAFDGAVLMGDAGIVARRRHAVMAAELIVAARQVCAGLGVEIAEGRRKAVGTVLARYATERPQGVLQPFRQGHETLPAEHDMGVFEAGIGQPEVIEPVIQRGASDRNAGIAHVSEIRKAHPAGLM